LGPKEDKEERAMRYDEFLARKKREYGDRFDASSLDERFIPYFNSGRRIEVSLDIFGVKRGTVGVTTGWRPVFLLILTKRSTGSHITLGAKDIIVREVGA
jgi:hypothetical protein